ncbi:hypothetical protein FOL47_010023 [Perkinsus chesapeaki]|uniref:WW domain-containing protein n=1 Tax=Perkinsus chesapeaki TaxID=330153 RepID=A0A7J6L5A3_PERCH|nr:hypothetical protein FOL47_010023 [Perkinsus chesapeaki]
MRTDTARSSQISPPPGGDSLLGPPAGQGKPPIVLEEEVDDNYEPTEQEIIEYAEWIGMNVEEDRDLFWIAKEGLKAPLPAPWKPCQTEEEDIFYFNFDTGESVWDHPCDEYYKKLYSEHKQREFNEAALEGEKGGADRSDDEHPLQSKKRSKDKTESPSERIVAPPALPALQLAPPLPGGPPPAIPTLAGLGELSRPSTEWQTARRTNERPLVASGDADHARDIASVTAWNSRELAMIDVEHTTAVAAMKEQHDKNKKEMQTGFNRTLSRLTDEHEREKQDIVKSHEREMQGERKRLREKMQREREKMTEAMEREVEEEMRGERERLREEARRRIEQELLDAERSCREAELSVINGDHAREIERLVEEHCEAVRKLRQRNEEELKEVKVEHEQMLKKLQSQQKHEAAAVKSSDSGTSSPKGQAPNRREVEARLEQELRPLVEKSLREEIEPLLAAEIRRRIEQEVRREIDEDLRAGLLTKERREEIENEVRHGIECELKQSGEVVESVRRELRDELRGPVEAQLRETIQRSMTERVEQEMRQGIRREVERELMAEVEVRVAKRLTEERKDMSLRESSVLADLANSTILNNSVDLKDSIVSCDFEGILKIMSERRRQLEAKEQEAAELISDKEERIAAALKRLHETREQLSAVEADATEKGHELVRLRREIANREKIIGSLRDQIATTEAEMQSDRRDAEHSVAEAHRELRRRQRVLDEREAEVEAREIRHGEMLREIRAKEASLLAERRRLQDDSSKLEAEAAEIATMQQTLKSITHEVKQTQDMYSSPLSARPPMTARPITDTVIMSELEEIKSAIVQLSARGSRPFGTRAQKEAIEECLSSDSAHAMRRGDGAHYWLRAERESLTAAKKRMAAEHAMSRAERARLEMERQIWKERMREAKRNGDSRAKGELLRAKAALDSRAADYNVSVAAAQVEAGKLEEREKALEKYAASRIYRDSGMGSRFAARAEPPPPMPFSDDRYKYTPKSRKT